ncbi:MAG: dual specificity protein phosphatase family protein [Pseudodesulfovibrio sp.]|uniref:Dual specificity protein phosphatase n=1 Tax=Pseudodesulfovibrio aespoeensis (strain ATCC 700646 / DSM 10631 / Aspo-2) TaxID=643562 RepID=E6VU15_PSEA9|nr:MULTISPECIES: dual specificity protein phosphatase [Pseudodesulfovibrio]MBU4191722.1 dual specificity protein phosphatase family protein [Pseudomonadota bacterium]ADU62208.1 Dual specificity protein phosphatase [Pseudodesulfovibrio aespoeensis Aspo-2]MBU4243194.1 dual specificity protein phosphatase family protein [Pseudomonadota bacterium]MBU4377556.1 dual specificity protein phosphatase family protein [Pseudomonadota bacterium]MBU4476103.1 dual specificity protein phosphatase family prote
MFGLSRKPAYQVTWVTDQLGVGNAPMSHAQLDAIRNEGVDAILNLCGEFCDLHDIEKDAGFEVHYLPLADEEAPDLIELEKALAWLDEAIYLGKKVLIHCRHGIGRTGTVLNSYLLRRGLGHKLAWRALKKLKSKPANFVQWRTVRKYGKQSGRLTVREPSLEFKRLVDLSPFFNDYDELVQRVDERAGQARAGMACGLDHDQCCRTPVRLSLVEAVHLSHRINRELCCEDRLLVIERAVETAQAERQAARDLGREQENLEYCLSEVGTVCPLLVDGVCMLFAHRPLQCRAFGLDESEDGELWSSLLTPALDKISGEMWFAYTGTMVEERLPLFSLPDVVSGKFMERVFKLMLQLGLPR